MEKKEPYIDEYELEKACIRDRVGNIRLQTDYISHVVENIFDNNHPILEDYAKQIRSSSKNSKMWFLHHDFTTVKNLASILPDAVETVKFCTAYRTNKILVIGVSSELVDTAIVHIARKLGIQSVTFSDLCRESIEETKDVFSKVRDPLFEKEIKINFLEGDFLEKDGVGNEEYDLVIVLKCVTSQIAKFNSTKILKESRKKLFQKISNLLVKRGIFIEEVENTTSLSFDYLARLKTHKVLRDKRLLNGENQNIIVTTELGCISAENRKSLQGTFLPKILYAPPFFKHYQELKTAGMDQIFTNTYKQATGIRNHHKLAIIYKKMCEELQRDIEYNCLWSVSRYLEDIEKNAYFFPDTFFSKSRIIYSWQKNK